jgi:hypothetical protein
MKLIRAFVIGWLSGYDCHGLMHQSGKECDCRETMNVGIRMVMVMLALALGSSSKSIASTIGLTLPGTGVSVAPCTIVSGSSTVTCSSGSSNFQSNYSTRARLPSAALLSQQVPTQVSP